VMRMSERCGHHVFTPAFLPEFSRQNQLADVLRLHLRDAYRPRNTNGNDAIRRACMLQALGLSRFIGKTHKVQRLLNSFMGRQQ
jgi:hypothetical protein